MAVKLWSQLTRENTSTLCAKEAVHTAKRCTQHGTTSKTTCKLTSHHPSCYYQAEQGNCTHASLDAHMHAMHLAGVYEAKTLT